MDWKCISLIGSREINEDCFKVVEHNDVKCFIVADGLGGHGKGDVASSLACDAFEGIFTELSAPLPDLLSSAFLKAQALILAEQKKNGSQFQMKTTVCALVVRGDEAAWGHIGDTRLYTFSRNKVKSRTLDHSVPQMLVLTRDIKERDIRNHPDRNKLLRVLGISGDTPKYEISEIQALHKYQAFLLCSDGFWELILEKEMGSFLKKSASVDEWMEKMCEVVMQRGAKADMDNSSAIAIWV